MSLLRAKRSYDCMNEDFVKYSPNAKKLKSNGWKDPKIEKTINKSPSQGKRKDITRYNKHVIQKLAEIQIRPLAQQTSEKMFSLSDVNDIVNKALSEREEQLREAHNNTLSQHIIEQMGALSKYNQEFVSQRLRNSEFHYMS